MGIDGKEVFGTRVPELAVGGDEQFIGEWYEPLGTQR